jgi:hypothetical protein
VTEAWSSSAIPDWTRAGENVRTPSGLPAVFQSSSHAWIGLRLVYLGEVKRESSDSVALKAQYYRWAWERYVRHGSDMQRLVAAIDTDPGAAAAIWNSINQVELDEAYSAVICERESVGSANLATVALRHFQLNSDAPTGRIAKDRALSDGDNQKVWQISMAGACRSCGTPTISQRSYDHLRKLLAANSDRFNLEPSYKQTNGKTAPLWSNRVPMSALAATTAGTVHRSTSCASPRTTFGSDRG